MPSRKQSPNTPKPSETSDRPAAGRRKLLKSALLGGGAAGAWLLAPERWTRPVIESVTLPAHAQTSAPTLGEGPWASGEPIRDVSLPRDRSLAQRLSDFFVRPAAAGRDIGGSCPSSFGICISRTGSGNEIEVRIGFSVGSEDSRTFTPAGDLTFTRKFSDNGTTWMVHGQYHAGLNRWTGSVNGPCPDSSVYQDVSLLWEAETGNLCPVDALSVDAR